MHNWRQKSLSIFNFEIKLLQAFFLVTDGKLCTFLCVTQLKVELTTGFPRYGQRNLFAGATIAQEIGYLIPVRSCPLLSVNSGYQFLATCSPEDSLARQW